MAAGLAAQGLPGRVHLGQGARVAGGQGVDGGVDALHFLEFQGVDEGQLLGPGVPAQLLEAGLGHHEDERMASRLEHLAVEGHDQRLRQGGPDQADEVARLYRGAVANQHFRQPVHTGVTHGCPRRLAGGSPGAAK